MLRLQGESVYLTTLEKEHCQILWEAFEYDEKNITESLDIGHSIEKAVDWFNEIQRLQGDRNVRLGIFLRNRSCSIGLGIQMIEYRSKGYGRESVRLMLEHGFNNLG